MKANFVAILLYCILHSWQSTKPSRFSQTLSLPFTCVPRYTDLECLFLIHSLANSFIYSSIYLVKMNWEPIIWQVLYQALGIQCWAKSDRSFHCAYSLVGWWGFINNDRNKCESATETCSARMIHVAIGDVTLSGKSGKSYLREQ